MDLNTDVRYIKGIGEKKAQALNKLGVFSLRDLVSFFPRKYEDRSETKPIALTAEGETVCVEAMVADTPRLTRVRRGLDLVKLRAVDESAVLDITFFNQPYTKDNLERGESYVFFGKIEVNGVRRSMVNPVYEKAEGERKVIGRIIPVYRVAAGLNQRTMLQAVRQGLDACLDALPDVLPHAVRERCGLAQTGYAFENIHFPADFEALELARRRLIFEELFVLACALGRMRGERARESGLPMPAGELAEFWAAMPFEPTGAQRRAVEDGLRDMRSGAVMNRLVQGDVGSGKTLVAAALIWYAAQNGYLSAFMAPTEILAEQHFHTLTELLGPLGLRIGKLTGSMTMKEKRLVKEQLRTGGLDLVIGTHALFSQDVEYERLGLVVTDEQHRFGVGQRGALSAKGRAPHVLVMSATPIPRTLSLIVYGDLAISVLDEKPKGRQAIDTYAVPSSFHPRIYAFLKKHLDMGRQAYIVCPLAEEKPDEDELETASRLSAEAYMKELSAGVFKDYKTALLHGKMKPKEKDAIMADFVRGDTQLLICTVVIEVGIDVPNANVIVIENAECFGLSQLHQLRGRVGRGDAKSYCVLISDAEGETAKERFAIMTETNDGFQIAEKDLEMRGPGDFFGARQSGLPDLRLANLMTDSRVLYTAQRDAKAILAADPDLTDPRHVALAAAVKRLFAEIS